MGIVQIAVMGVAGAILAIQFKNGKSEYGIYISIASVSYTHLDVYKRQCLRCSNVKEN